MLSAIRRAPFARPLFLSSVSRLAKPAAIARPSLLLEARRTFLTTAPAAATEVKATTVKKPKTAAKTKSGAPKAKAKKATTPKVKKVQADKPKERKILKKDLKVPHRRPNSAWQDFYIKYQREHKKEGDVFGSLAPEASAIWRDMSAEEKAKYGAPAEEREEYKRLAAEYRSTDIFKKAARKLRKRRPRDGPMSAYSLFVKETYDKTSPLSFLEQGKAMAKQWHEKSAEEKEAYRQRCVEIYEKEKAAAAATEAEN